MVQLFAYEHGQAARPTTDVDILADARDRPSKTEVVAGFALEDLYEESTRGLEERLRAAGLVLEEIPRLPMDLSRSPRERGADVIKLMRANLIGDGEEPARADPEAMRALFDQVRLAADPSEAPRGTVVQWSFTDADPWHVRLDDPEVVAAPGGVQKPDVTLRMGLQDFVDMSAGRVSGPRMLLTRRLRPRGNLRLLARMDRIFGPPPATEHK